MGRFRSDKWLSDKMTAEREMLIVKARNARRNQHSTPTERAAARDEISDYLARVPNPPTYPDEL